MCEKDLYCMDWAVKMMQKVCKVFSTPWERNNFLQCLESTFAHMLMDMLQAVLSGKAQPVGLDQLLDQVLELPMAPRNSLAFPPTPVLQSLRGLIT